MRKICKGCGKLLDVSDFPISKKSKNGYENKCKKCRLEQRKKHTKICETCKKIYITANKKSKFCSNICSGVFKQNRVVANCAYCEKEILIPKNIEKIYKNHYCNNKCKYEHQKILMKGEINPNYSSQKYICDGCGKEITVETKKIKKQKHIFCSNECYIKNIGKFITGKNHPNYIRVECICSQCGKRFYRRPSAIKTKNVYCSEKCHIEMLKSYNNFKRNKVKHNCEICDKEIEIYPFDLKNKNHIYCSRKCQSVGFSKYYSKENSHSWNNNIPNVERILNRHYLEYNNWRISVYERDNYTCQCCGDNKGGNLNAHHICNYSSNKELRLEVKNGITFCKKCHKKFHDKYGYTNNNLEQLNKFIKNHNFEVS